jgi:hypothetical protein
VKKPKMLNSGGSPRRARNDNMMHHSVDNYPARTNSIEGKRIIEVASGPIKKRDLVLPPCDPKSPNEKPSSVDNSAYYPLSSH